MMHLPFLSLCLSIWSVAVSAKTSSDYYIQSLPGQPDGPTLRMHAGHIEVTPEHHGNLFFWHFENKHLANRHRTVIWLNGGPGCSSLDGALMEIGPYRLKSDGSGLEYNPGSWDEFTNLLFIDNPVGTGFSYVDSDSYLHELSEMSDQFVTFLEKYFALFPEQESNDLYIAGESYAGQHIPHVAKAIIDRNASPNSNHKWNLKGLLIGNGWVAPDEQSMAYLDYAYKMGVVEKDSDIAKQIEAQRTICKEELAKDGKETKVNYPSCEKILHKILELTVKDGRCVNMYDVRLDDTYPSCGMNWPPDLKQITPYLRRQDVVSALHIDPEKKSGWTECSGAVGGAFKARHSQPSIQILPDILKEVPVLLFSGDQDMICGHTGTEAFIHNMEWNGAKGFELSPGTWAPRKDWTFMDEPAGYYQEARNLTYVLFYNASHMVPFDYPRRTRDMLDRFMGVDIGSVGGEPADSRINGEKVPQTSVGGHPNSTQAEQQVEEKLDQERWNAYYRSGSIALVIVAILAVCFGWYVWQDRRRRRGYRGLAGNDSARGLMSETNMRGDLEASAFDVDNNELDSLRNTREGAPRYSLGGVSSDEEDEGGHRKDLNGHANGKS